MQRFPAGTTGRVIKPYQQPYPDPLKVRAGDKVFPDHTQESDWPGWVWCASETGKAGWAPQAWLTHRDDGWHITRDYDAIELTVRIGDPVTIEFAESGFLWVRLLNGQWGWAPESHVEFLAPAAQDL